MKINIKSLFTRENIITSLSFLWLFILMVAYYIIKPVRDTLVNELPCEALPYLMLGVMVIILIVNVFYNYLARILSSNRLIIAVTLFFGTILVLFSFAISAEWPSVNIPFLGVQPGRYVCTVFYFLFVGVYNVFTVTIFWSFINEVFRADEARSRFGMVTAGGTLGGLLGSTITSRLASRINLGYLLLFSVSFLFITLVFMKLLSLYKDFVIEERAIEKLKDSFSPEKLTILAGEIGSVFSEKRLSFFLKDYGFSKDEILKVLSVLSGEESSITEKGSPEKSSGFSLVFRSAYLRWILLAVFLMTSSATMLTYQMNAIIKYSIHDEVTRAQFWANINFWVNGLGLFFQLFAVQWTVRRFGFITTILIAPILDITGCFFMIGSQGLFSGRICHVGRYSTQFSFNRASREMLYTPTTRDFKYQAKAIIDTFVFRFGDGCTSLLLIFLSGWSLHSIAILSLFVNLIRIVPALALVKHYNKLIKREKL